MDVCDRRTRSIDAALPHASLDRRHGDFQSKFQENQTSSNSEGVSNETTTIPRTTNIHGNSNDHDRLSDTTDILNKLKTFIDRHIKGESVLPDEELKNVLECRNCCGDLKSWIVTNS